MERMMIAGILPDVESCNSILGTFADDGQNTKVEEWLAVMEGMGISPDVESYNHAMRSLTVAGDIEGAERIMKRMVDRELGPNLESYTLLIGNGTSARDHSFVDLWSQKLADTSLKLDARTFTAIIGAFASVDDVRSAEEWFSQMVDAEIPTVDALAIVVEALVLSSQNEGVETAEEWINQLSDVVEPSQSVYAALAAADVEAGDFEQVEARMQQMEADGLEISEVSLTALLLAYANAKPQQSQLAEQMFKQQMLRGKMMATRPVLEALRAAVGGARCLSLRRELQLTNQTKSSHRLPQGFSDKKSYKQWMQFAPRGEPKQKLLWE